MQGLGFPAASSTPWVGPDLDGKFAESFNCVAIADSYSAVAAGTMCPSFGDASGDMTMGVNQKLELQAKVNLDLSLLL